MKSLRDHPHGSTFPRLLVFLIRLRVINLDNHETYTTKRIVEFSGRHNRRQQHMRICANVDYRFGMGCTMCGYSAIGCLYC